VSGGLGRLVLTARDRSAIRKLFTETAAGRSLSLRFVAGETLDQAVSAARELNAIGAQVSLDHLGEHVAEPAAALTARGAYLACLERIGSEGLDANISVKLTQLGLGFDSSLALQSLTALAERARSVGTTVSVDMEESVHTDATIEVYEKVQGDSGNVGIAIQAYLYRTRADLDRLIRYGGHIRLCKGAYAELPEIAFVKKSDVDRNFDALTRVLMRSPEVVPAIATHDEERIALARRLGAMRGRPWEFQMLYGIRTKLQRELISSGYPLRVYVPYGAAWYPYLTRRLAERPANLAFFLRAAVRR
jgi:proline dehydrogenase